jgi:hypothetical protein
MPISIKPAKRRTSFYLSDSVINALRSLEGRFELTSLSAAVEFAVVYAANNPLLDPRGKLKTSLDEPTVSSED